MAMSSLMPTKADALSMTEPAARRLAFEVSYDGAAFFGFQRQPGFRTVQEELELAWAAFTAEKAVIHGSGRTDSGVHARAQVVHLSTMHHAPAATAMRAMNAYLPEDLAITAVAEVPMEFHARHSAIAKHYLYTIAAGPTRPVLARRQVWWLRRELDVTAMRAASQYFLGTHDFAAFAAAGRSVKTTIRRVRSVHLQERRGLITIHVRGDGFLYRQVRNMVGSLVEVGLKKRDPRWIQAVLQSGDRSRAGQTAPAAGLTMWRVHYPSNPFASVPADVSYK